MKVKFDSLNRFEVPKMFLCNPGSIYRSDDTLSSVIGILHNTSDEEIVFNFNATSELNFRIYNIELEDEDENAQAIKNYKSIQNRRMIFVENIGYFIITEIKDGSSEGKEYKDVTASSCEVEIEYKNIPYIKDGTYQFRPLLAQLVSVLPSWTIGEVHSEIASKYRTFEDISEDKNILGFFMEDMQDAYECIFIFDTINRVINVYDQNDFVVQTPIHLTRDDFINSIEITENSDDLYTAISVMGDENLNITAINPTGTNTIYNFDYYLAWMSDGLRVKVEAWQTLIKEKFDTYYSLNLQYYNILTEQSDAKHEMDMYQAQITMYTRCKENMVASSSTYAVESYNELIVAEGGDAITIYDDISETIAEIKRLIAEAQTGYNSAKAKYDACAAQLQIVQANINSIRSEVAIENYFSDEEYAELYNYIFEGSYNDEYITITESMTFSQRFEQMKTLYDRAEEQLKKISRPTQKFSIDLENFLFVKDFENWSEQLQTGCLINIELNYDDIAALFLSTIAINYDDKTLNFTFGNRFNKYDPKSLFKDALGNIKKSSNSINYIKDIIYPIKDGKLDEIAEVINNSRNLTKNAVLASKNEEVLIDDTGYTGRSKTDNGEISPNQIKITGRNIVFTDDAWDTCKVAIGEVIVDDDTVVYGINAETIIGNLIFGNQLIIKNNDESMAFNEDGLVITNGNNKVIISPRDNTSIFSIQTNNDNILSVDANGLLSVTGHITAIDGSFTGKIYAEEGLIGGFQLIDKKLSVTSDAYINPTYIDARHILQYNAGLYDFSTSALSASDINKDNTVSALDARLALQILANIRDYSSCAGAVKGTVTAVIDPTDIDKLISVTATNAWGTSVDTYIGVNGIKTPKVNTYGITINNIPVSAEQILLYNNTSGTAGTVTLSESVLDFDWLYIVVGDDTTGQTGSAIVFLPNNKTVNISASTAGSDGVDIKSVSYTISNTSMTLNSNRQSKYINGNWTFNSNNLKCKCVIGFRGANYGA